MIHSMGSKIAERRKYLGLTQTEFAEKLLVTRQTVSRWEGGTVMPDIEKIGDIASLLGVSCDYLLKDDAVLEDDTAESRQAGADRASAGKSAVPNGIGRLLQSLKGRRVQLQFFEDEADIDLFNKECRILDFEGNWMKVSVDTGKGTVEKLIPVSSILSVALGKGDN